MVAHNYICLHKLDSSFDIESVSRAIDAKLRQAASIELLAKVHIVVETFAFKVERNHHSMSFILHVFECD